MLHYWLKAFSYQSIFGTLHLLGSKDEETLYLEVIQNLLISKELYEDGSHRKCFVGRVQNMIMPTLVC